jgi:hypothetical protein
MNDLSNSSDPHVAPQATPPPVVPISTPTGNKEVVGGSINPHESLRDATGQEFELPKEVSSAGVRMHPTRIAVPPPVSQLGVKPAGQNVPVQTTPTVPLPLTDDQIAVGLHASVTSSVRWLSEWCIRRLKQLHVAVKTVHGKLIRVPTI